jgi:hypothetical protein
MSYWTQGNRFTLCPRLVSLLSPLQFICQTERFRLFFLGLNRYFYVENKPNDNIIWFNEYF